MAKSDDKIIKDALEIFKDCTEESSEERQRMEDDLKFAGGQQWPEQLRNARENDPRGSRPCLTMDRTNQYVRQVVNDARQNKPAIKTIPVDERADIETAQVLNGVCRYIENTSNAPVAYDTALDNAVKAGLGWFRVNTVMVNPERNEQDIRIARVPNIFSVTTDSWVEPDGSDMMHCFVTEEMHRRRFEAMYPKADVKGWDADGPAIGWVSQDAVRVAEYYCVKEEESNILLLDDESLMTETEYWEAFSADQYRPQVVGNRSYKKRVVKWYKMTAGQVLDETEVPSQWIPVVPVIGNEHWVEGKRRLTGMIRWVADAQRAFNYARSAYVEHVALQPKAPFIAAAGQIAQYRDVWEKANIHNYAVLEYDPETVAGKLLPPPQRQMPPSGSSGWIQDMQLAERDIQSALGMYAASLGSEGQEKSGKAILARQREGDTSTFHYIDNLSRSIRHAGRIIIEMIPKVYDTRRVVQIIGEDDKQSQVTFDPQLPQSSAKIDGVRSIYNPSVGQYDVTVTIGPSYNSKREEAATAMMEITKGNPQIMPMIGDLLVRAMDWPMADRIADRLKAMVPPEVLQAEQAGQGGEDAKIKMAVQKVQQQAEMQAQQAVQALEAMQQQVQQLMQENEGLKSDRQSDLVKMQIDMQKLQLDAQKIQLEAQKVQIQEFEAETDRMQTVMQSETQQIQAMQTESSSQQTMSAIDSIMQQVQAMSQQIAELVAEEAEPSRKVIKIQAPSGAVYTGIVDDSITIQSPSGETYTGTVEEQ